MVNIDTLKNATFDYFFRNSTGEIDPELIKDTLGDETSKEIENSLKQYLYAKYAGVILLTTSLIFSTGYYIGLKSKRTLKMKKKKHPK